MQPSCPTHKPPFITPSPLQILIIYFWFTSRFACSYLSFCALFRPVPVMYETCPGYLLLLDFTPHVSIFRCMLPFPCVTPPCTTSVPSCRPPCFPFTPHLLKEGLIYFLQATLFLSLIHWITLTCPHRSRLKSDLPC
ncbi:hypothetical protein CRM22_006927 [Opisthorchis felineus]|uniref:Uncharacterized protein n=1 Tax=Opisthorchis felineus TaxID=147828 RepID=A0A4S2LIZ1_OPIFE|nr:hypothetical protein CRM22_006927 [Opisthorchis felineus]